MYYVALALFCAGFLFVERVVHSPFGQILQAVREAEHQRLQGAGIARHRRRQHEGEELEAAGLVAERRCTPRPRWC
jgi:hypothetical protein